MQLRGKLTARGGFYFASLLAATEGESGSTATLMCR